MDPAQFAELKSMLVEMLTPVRDLALFQLAQVKQPIPDQPTTRSILAEQAARSDAAKRVPVPPGPGNTAPYSVFTVPFAADDGSWEVRGSGGITTGFVGTQDEANTEATRLNDSTASEAAARADRMANPPAAPVVPALGTPYRAQSRPDGGWEVVNADGTSAGFAGTEAEANTEAERRNVQT